MRHDQAIVQIGDTVAVNAGTKRQRIHPRLQLSARPHLNRTMTTTGRRHQAVPDVTNRSLLRLFAAESSLWLRLTKDSDFAGLR